MNSRMVGLICAVVAGALFLLAAFHVDVTVVDLTDLGLVFFTAAVVFRGHVHHA